MLMTRTKDIVVVCLIVISGRRRLSICVKYSKTKSNQKLHTKQGRNYLCISRIAIQVVYELFISSASSSLHFPEYKMYGWCCVCCNFLLCKWWEGNKSKNNKNKKLRMQKCSILTSSVKIRLVTFCIDLPRKDWDFN